MRCFLVLCLLAGCTVVAGLVNEELAVPHVTTSGYQITEPMNITGNTSYADSAGTYGCGNGTVCKDICDFCHGVPPLDCLHFLVQHRCSKVFEDTMNSLNNTDWCIWSNVRSAYNNFTICTEETAECLLIPWPNPLVEQIFVDIHAMFFQDCPTEELTEPPPGIVFALVMTPICLIPVMVILVVLKTKNGDGSS